MGIELIDPPSSSSGGGGPVTGPLDGGDGRPAGEPIEAGGFVWNGATWDRLRSVAGDALPATGIPAAGLYGWNGATWDRLRSSIAQGLAVDVTRVQGTVTTTGTVASSGPFDAGDGIVAGSTPREALYGWNGATWDRLRSSIAQGLAVDVTRVQGTVTVGPTTTPADGLANTAGLATVDQIEVWDSVGAVWNRAVQAPAADNAAATGLPAVGLMLSDGTTWDRARTVINDSLTASSGVLAAASLLWNSAGPTWERMRVNTNDGVTLGIVSAGGLVFDPVGAVWNRNRQATADTLAAAGIPAAGLYGWNGATWDRLRSSIAQGLAVDVTRVQGTVTTTGTVASSGPFDAGDGIVAGSTPREALYGWNGATWDRLRSSIAQGLAVDVTRVQGTIGVTQSTSPWVVSGTVTVSTPTTPADGLGNTAGVPVVAQNEVWNGATWDRMREATADGMAATGISAAAWMVWNGATWDRKQWRQIPASGGAIAPGSEQALPAVGPVGWDGTNYRLFLLDTAGQLKVTVNNIVGVTSGQTTPADTLANTVGLPVVAQNEVWNGATWDRLREATADAQTAVGLAAAGGQVFNGATWDRSRGDTTQGTQVGLKRVTLVQAASPAANTAATLTLPAVAGQFHYITHLYIARSATALLAGGATLAVTTTNLNGLTWRTGNQASITVSTADGMILTDAEYVHPIRSAVVNTASTIVLPAPGAAVLWTAWVAYYTGP